MAENPHAVRRSSFEAEYLAWTALSHFLPVALARELFDVISVRVTTDGLRFDQCCDQDVTDGAECLRSWCFWPRRGQERAGAFVRSLARSYAWAHDHPVHPSPEDAPPTRKAEMTALAAALAMGRADFVTFDRSGAAKGQPGVDALAAALASGPPKSESADEMDAWSAQVEEVGSPLGAILLKHLGDLCADVDQWRCGLRLYERAEARLADLDGSAWSDFASDLQSIIRQSKASALRTLVGATSAADELRIALADSSPRGSPLMRLNAGTDELAARSLAEDWIWHDDVRAVLVSAPTLVDTHDLSSAMEHWRRGRHAEAQDAFWASLRRQTALGAASASRWTKSLFAQCIIDELAGVTNRQRVPAKFELALRLLVEGGDAESVGQIAWAASTVASYVDASLVSLVERHVGRHAGAMTERRLVAAALFEKWATLLPVERTGPATAMLKFLASAAREADDSSRLSEKLAERSLAGLRKIAEVRPEFLAEVFEEIAGAVTKRIVKATRWPVTAEAIETATTILDANAGASSAELVDAVLDKLDGIDPAAGLWPVVGPALKLLSSKACKTLRQVDSVRGRRIVAAILRFGLGQETEHARMLFMLEEVGPDLLGDEPPTEDIARVVAHVRAEALKSNSSAAVSSIQALLIAPAFIGREGFEDAIKGLRSILTSATSRHPSLCFAQAYVLLLLLADQRERLIAEVPVSDNELTATLKSLVPLVAAIWEHAAQHPLVFKTFSLPPATTPDKNVAHNWAFASIDFGRAMQEDGAISAALEAASGRPELRTAIALARISKMTGDLNGFDPDTVEREDAETFYAAIGQRLVNLRRLEATERPLLCAAMVRRCLLLGPRVIDAGVFLAALEAGVGGDVASTHTVGYLRRMDGSRELHLCLVPALRALGLLPIAC